MRISRQERLRSSPRQRNSRSNISAGGAPVRSLLADLTGRFPGLDNLVFSAPGVLRDLVNILRNGRNIHFLAGLETILEDGDTIALFPPSAGG